jgi:hypothetical protein
MRLETELHYNKRSKKKKKKKKRAFAVPLFENQAERSTFFQHSL